MKKLKTHVLMVSRVFPTYHKRKGEETLFPIKIIDKEKIHTCRSNYDLWKKRIDEVNAGEAILSVRIWSGKPYCSKQVEIKQYDKYSGIGIQQLLEIDKDIFYVRFMERGLHIQGLETLATNDGLSLEDFKEWFKKPITEPMAIIHFTDFRY